MSFGEVEIGAVVLSIGEASVDRAIDSLDSQTLPLAQTVLIEHVEPFSKALFEGYQQIKTPFFVQCDADMVLSEDCLEVLLSGMDSDCAVCAGYLQDDILGPIQAVKLFRTAALAESFNGLAERDSDMILELFSRGWRIKYCRRSNSQIGLENHVLGYHSPNYDDAAYTFYKFYRHGATVRHRHSFPEFEGILERLKKSEHPMANLALTAFCKGMFEPKSRNLHVVPVETPEYREFRAFQTTEAELQTLVFATTKLPGIEIDEFPKR